MRVDNYIGEKVYTAISKDVCLEKSECAMLNLTLGGAYSM